MTIRQTCAYIVMASGILFTIGCSLMVDQPKGDSQSDSTVSGHSKSLAGVYADLGSDGSIKPHPQSVGHEGRITGLIILGGSADVLDIKTGNTTIKGSKGNTTPTVTMGGTTFSPGSGSNSTGTSGRTPEAGSK